MLLSKAVTRLSVQLVIRYPFFGHLLTGMLKEEGPISRAALAVGEGFQPLLLVGRSLIEEGSFTEDQRLGAVKHELLHLLYRHPTQLRWAADRLLFHLAADLVVNQYLSPQERPADAITLDRLADLAPEPFREVGYYYELLAEGIREGHDVLQPLLAAVGGGHHPELQRHRYWEEVIFFLGAAEVGLLEDTVAELTRTALLRAGAAGLALPLQTAVTYQFVRQRPAVDWRRLLRLFASSSRRTTVRNTIRRPSRRYGTAPGIKVRRGSRLLVALDTSASVSREQLVAFGSEVQHLWRLGHEIHVVENDTEIQSRYDYRGQWPHQIKGRGGTDFNAPLQLANEVIHPDGVVYFTDGRGPAPATRCRYPLLWVVAGEEGGAALPGRKVWMVDG